MAEAGALEFRSQVVRQTDPNFTPQAGRTIVEIQIPLELDFGSAAAWLSSRILVSESLK